MSFRGPLESHRIWLQLDGDAQTDRALVGYIEGATDGYDNLFDSSMSITPGFISLYSLIGTNRMAIQGKALPFKDSDTISIGFNAITNGNYSIGIMAVDGLFLESQEIYLEDKLLGIIHNLKTAPYNFSTVSGAIDDRFLLRYTTTLGTNQFELKNKVQVYTKEKAAVHSANQNIKTIVVFDLLGRKIDSYDNVNTKDFVLKNLNRTMSTLIMKITLDDDTVVTEKFLF